MLDLAIAKCHICSKTVRKNKKRNWSQALKSHVDIHKNVKPFDCLKCGMTFSQRTDAVRQRHSVYKLHSKEDLLKCHSCSYSTTNKRHFQNHISTHFGKMLAQHFCFICKAQFIQLHHLKAHMDGHNNLKRYQCEKCGQKLGTLRLSSHSIKKV